MAQIVLNGEQFRQLVAGKVVSIGSVDIRLGELGFRILEVSQASNWNGAVKNRPYLIKRPK